jgi:membrane protease YdiL (CAAX protease family)
MGGRTRVADWQKMLGVLVMAAGGWCAGHAGAPDAAAVAWGVLTLAAVGAGGFLWGHPLGAGVVAAVSVALGTGPLGHWGIGQGVAAALWLALVAGLAAWLRRYAPGPECGPWDGVLAVGGMILIALTLGTLAPVPRPGPSYHQTAVVLLLYLATPPLELAVGLAVLSRGHRLAQFLRSRYGWRPGLGSALGVGAVAGIALILLSSLVILIESSWLGIRVVTNNPFVYSPRLSHQAPLWALVALVGAVVVLAPVAEELLFRGLLFGGLATRVGPGAAAVISAVVFGAAHLDWSLFLGLSLAGLVLNGLYWRHRSLWVSTVAHATLNGVSVMLALLVR